MMASTHAVHHEDEDVDDYAAKREDADDDDYDGDGFFFSDYSNNSSANRNIPSEEDDACNSLRSDAAMGMFLSRLSIESSDIGIEADADADNNQSYNSDKEQQSPPSGIRYSQKSNSGPDPDAKGDDDYASDDPRVRLVPNQKRGKRSLRRTSSGGCNNESEGSSGGGLMVMTRPKGGNRGLCMGLNEVEACRDLGFELEGDQRMLPMLEIPSPSAAQFDSTSPDGADCNSPIASAWQISSPGDDPRDVKARLKVWAHAVALASTSCQSS